MLATGEFGAELPAPVVIHASDEALRGMLLHEFAHCFNYIRRALATIDRGESEIDLPQQGEMTLEEWDKMMLDPPEAWFSADDVAIFPYHHSELIAECTERMGQEWFLKGLLTVMPDLNMTASRISVPEVISAHIRRNPINV